MENVLLLPGYSEKNREDLHSLREYLQMKGFKVHVREWPHWEGGVLKASIEIEKIAQLIRDFNIAYVVAKSVGTRILAMGVEQEKIDLSDVRKIILTGIPSEKVALKWQGICLKSSDVIDFTFMQNQHDPLLAAEELKQVLGECLDQVDFRVRPYSDHRYYGREQDEFYEILKENNRS